MAKKLDPAKAKAKRQKLIAIVGGVLLLALLAFQLPRTMKMLKNPGNVTTSSATTSASTTTAAGATPLAPPTLEGGSSAPTAGAGSGVSADTSSDGVRDPSTPLPPDSGQLVSFSRFKSKDPFAQQVTSCGTGSCDTGGSNAGAATPASSAGSTGSGGGTGSSAGGSSKTAAAKPAPAPAISTAVISVNGKAESVRVGKSFPSDDPVFLLVRATRTEAIVSIAGGSLESGAPALRLRVGKSVTLQNTADGTRYVLKLLRTG